jgi:hypothetical protein
MIGYRFLRPAEEEMIGAAKFYEVATAGLGADFLDEVGRVVNLLREHPDSARPSTAASEELCFTVFPSALFTRSKLRLS